MVSVPVHSLGVMVVCCGVRDNTVSHAMLRCFQRWKVGWHERTPQPTPRTCRHEDGPARQHQARLDGAPVVEARDGPVALDAHVPQAEPVVVTPRDEHVGRRRVGGAAADVVAVPAVRREELPRGEVPVFLLFVGGVERGVYVVVARERKKRESTRDDMALMSTRTYNCLVVRAGEERQPVAAPAHDARRAGVAPVLPL